MRKRSRHEIHVDLMQAILGHTDPKDIATSTHLPLSDTLKHLDFLVSEGFVRIPRRAKKEREYRLTPTGSEALEGYLDLGKTRSKHRDLLSSRLHNKVESGFSEPDIESLDAKPHLIAQIRD